MAKLGVKVRRQILQLIDTCLLASVLAGLANVGVIFDYLFIQKVMKGKAVFADKHLIITDEVLS